VLTAADFPDHFIIDFKFAYNTFRQLLQCDPLPTRDNRRSLNLMSLSERVAIAQGRGLGFIAGQQLLLEQWYHRGIWGSEQSDWVSFILHLPTI
jgi:hypothetical protein